MEEIEKNDYNLNISRYVSAAKREPIIDLKEVNKKRFEWWNKFTTSFIYF